MTTAFLTHSDCLAHDVPRDHPERPGRLRAVLRALEERDLLREDAPLATDADLLRVHPEAYLNALAGAAPREGFTALDGDTWLSPGTLAAARRGVGGAIRAVDMVMAGTARSAFVATRPPGHHAERTTPMGFCYFGTVAAAAFHALDHHGLARVAIVDFDVHHGNGTQDLVQADPRIGFFSTHQMPLFPGTGSASDRGASGQVLNVPLRAGDGSAAFRAAMERQILPALDAFAPELILISAGFDAHRDDPLANLELEEADFAWVTEKLCDAAGIHASGRIVSCLEGGYSLRALANSVAAHVDVLIARAG